MSELQEFDDLLDEPENRETKVEIVEEAAEPVPARKRVERFVDNPFGLM